MAEEKVERCLWCGGTGTGKPGSFAAARNLPCERCNGSGVEPASAPAPPDAEGEQRPPGPPTPPIVPGHAGWPDRPTLDRLAATLGMFEWLEANGFVKGELERLRTAFMWEHGPTAQRWLDQADPPPSWVQTADLLKAKQAAEARTEALQAAAGLVVKAWEDDLGWSKVDAALVKLRSALSMQAEGKVECACGAGCTDGICTAQELGDPPEEGEA